MPVEHGQMSCTQLLSLNCSDDCLYASSIVDGVEVAVVIPVVYAYTSDRRCCLSVATAWSARSHCTLSRRNVDDTKGRLTELWPSFKSLSFPLTISAFRRSSGYTFP